jgi:hypothetical protein
MQTALKTFEDGIAGANHKSLSDLSEDFEKQQEISERHLKDYEKIYELSKLSRNISKSLDSTDSVKS